MKASRGKNIDIVTAYNDTLSAHRGRELFGLFRGAANEAELGAGAVLAGAGM